jgi:hypothetical protein
MFCRVLYTVPSRLVGRRLRIRQYEDRIEPSSPQSISSPCCAGDPNRAAAAAAVASSTIAMLPCHPFACAPSPAR